MEKIIFENLPSTNTPINASNLNQLQTNVENEFNKITNYSTEEQIIGTWFGKPLYKKTFRINNIGTEQSLGLTNLDDFFIDVSNSYVTWDDGVRYPTDRALFELWYGDQLSIIAKGDGAETWRAVITVKYTKTTD